MSLKISLNERGSNIKTLMLLMKGEGWVERMRKGEGGMGGGYLAQRRYCKTCDHVFQKNTNIAETLCIPLVFNVLSSPS